MLSGLLLAGCIDPAPETTAADKPVIRIAGSGPHLVLLKTLAELYPQRSQVDFEFIADAHSAAALQGVVEGAADVGGLSGRITDAQAAQGIAYYPLSRDGLVLVVHPSTEVASVTRSQARDIYTGRITNWSELGGRDQPIVVLDRAEDSSAKKAFRRFVIGDAEVTSNTVPLFYEEDMLQGVTRTPGAIAYASLGAVVSQGVSAPLLSLDGVKPSAEAVSSGAYEPTRELGMVAKSNPSDAVRQFVEWARSSEVARQLAEKGYAAPGVAAVR